MIHSRQQKQIFWLVQIIFYTFFVTLPVKTFFLSSENVFLNESFILTLGEGISLQCKPSTVLERFFLLPETVPDMSENQFFTDRTYSCWLKLIFQLVETIFLLLPQVFFKEPFIQFKGNAFFNPKENVLFFIQGFLLCWRKTLFYIIEKPV